MIQQYSWGKFRFFSVFGIILAFLFFISSQATITPAFAADTINTSEYMDSNNNGTVDRIRWTMDETVTSCAYEAGDWTVNNAGSINISITGLSCTGADSILNILVNADGLETGGVTDPIISYANAGTSGSVALASGNMTAKSNITATDGAAPFMFAQRYESGVLGNADRLIIVFTENTVWNGLDLNQFAIVNNDLTNFDNNGVAESFQGTSGTIIFSLITSGTTNLTGVNGGTEPTVQYTQSGTPANRVQDAAGNETPSDGSAVTLLDNATPAITSRTYQDNGNDGSVDRLLLGFSENVSYNGLDLNQFTIANQNLTGFDANGTPDTFVGGSGTSTLTFSTSGTTNLTGVSGGTQPTVAYVESGTVGNRITGNSIEIPSGLGAQSISDGAAPIFTSSVTADNDSNGIVDRITLGFSETVTMVDGNAGDGFSGISLNTCTIANQNLAAVGVTTRVVLLDGCAANNTGIIVSPTYVAAGVNDINDTVNEMTNGETITGTDGANPRVSSWALNISAKTLTLNFSESADASTLDATGITIQDAATAVDPTFTLTGGSTASVDGTQIIITVLDADILDIQANTSIATTTADTFLVITAAVIDDLSGNNLIAITNGSGLQASSVTSSSGGGRRRTTTSCGDGNIQSPNNNGQIETCDDGNTNSGDGCSNICLIENNASTSNGSGSRSISGPSSNQIISHNAANSELPTSQVNRITTRDGTNQIRDQLLELYGTRISLPRIFSTLSEGIIKNSTEVGAIINPRFNILLDQEELPEMTVINTNQQISVEFSHEAKLLRPLWVVISDINETDWKRLRISDLYGNSIHSFQLTTAGELRISLNYLRNLIIQITTPIEAKLPSDSINDPEKESILRLMERKIIQGNPDGTFKPEDSLNRAATSKLIGLLIGADPDKTKSGDQWFSGLQRALESAGILKGNTPPETVELRANFLALIAKSKGINIDTLPSCDTSVFSDVAIAEWYCPITQYAISEGWLREVSGAFKPGDVVTRSWAAGVLDRAFP